jgi:hypothetical protein
LNCNIGSTRSLRRELGSILLLGSWVRHTWIANSHSTGWSAALKR